MIVDKVSQIVSRHAAGLHQHNVVQGCIVDADAFTAANQVVELGRAVERNLKSYCAGETARLGRIHLLSRPVTLGTSEAE